MKDIITDLEVLKAPAKPLEFITEKGTEKEEGESIIKELQEVLDVNPDITGLTAPQIGIEKRVFAIRFADTIKYFINPIITKKASYKIGPETFISMPGKEILIIRPEEITVVYYTNEFKYEENKLTGIAARLFDQLYQALDGVMPNELGLVSDIEEDGSLFEIKDQTEWDQLIAIYKDYIRIKADGASKEVATNPDLQKQYDALCFTEKVINGQAALVGKSVSQKGQAVAALSIKHMNTNNKLVKRANMHANLKKRGKI